MLNRQAAVLNRMWCRRIALCTRVTRLPSSLLEDLKDLSGFFLGSDGSRPQNDDKLPELRIRAVAMLAWFFFRSYFRQPRPDSLHEMRVNPLVSHIVRSAYLCAVNDFLPPIIIRVASWFTSIQPFYGVDLRTLDTFSSRDSLWKAYEEYIQRQDALESKRLAKVASSPNWYRCAADGCGIQATNKGALRKCGGQCPTAVKPHYCSRECQEKVGTSWVTVHPSQGKLTYTGSIGLSTGTTVWREQLCGPSPMTTTIPTGWMKGHIDLSTPVAP